MSVSIARRAAHRILGTSARLMAAILLLALIAIIVFVMLVLSERGSAWLIHTATERFIDQGQVDKVSGSLGQGLAIEGFSGTFGETRVTLPSVEMRVEWTALLWQSRFELDYLVANGLTIEIPAGEDKSENGPPPPGEPAGTWPSLRLPIDMQIRRLQLTDTRLTLADAEHHLHYLGLRASLHPSHLNIEGLHLQYEELAISLLGRVNSGFPYRNDLRLDWIYGADEPWSGRARFHGNLQSFELEHRLVGLVVVDTAASVATGLQPDSMAFRLEALVADLANIVHVSDFALDDSEDFLNALVHLDLAGSAQHWALDVDGRAELGKHPPLILQAAGSGDLERFELDELRLTDGQGLLRAHGDVHWAPELAAQLRIALDSLDLSAWLPGTDLTLNGGLFLTAQQIDEAPAVTVALEPLKIGYDTLQAEATGHLEWHSGRAAIEDLRLVAADNHLTLSGYLQGEELGARWHLEAPQLAALGDDFAGRLTSTGNVSGSLSEPRVRISLDGQGVSVPGLAIDTLALQARPQGQGLEHQATLTATSLAAGDTLVDRIEVRLSGALEQHRLGVNARVQDESLSLDLSGGYQEESWRGRFEQLVVNSSLLGRWQTREPATAVYTSQSLQLAPLCLWQRDSSVCVSAAQAVDQSLQVEAELGHLPLHRFNEHWPSGTGVRGWLNGHARVILDDEGPSWQATFRSDDGQLLYAEAEDEEPETFSYSLQLDSRGDATTWQAGGSLSVNDQGTLNINVALDPTNELRLNGKVQARFVDLSWLDMFADPVSDISGTLQLDLDIAGVPGQPLLDGHLQLDQFTAYVAPVGIQLEDGQLEGRFHPSGRWQLRGGIRSGEGFLSIDSTIDLGDPEAWSVEFTTSGERLLIMDTPEIHSLASADLRGHLTAGNGIVNGRIGLSETRIRLAELPAGQQSITLSDDEVLYPQEEDTEVEPSYNLSADVELVIEDEVDFEGYGLSARADGRLSTQYRTGRPLTGEGRFALIEGRYRAYGQNLNIERGEVYFNGPLDNPAINIRAARTIRDVTAGIQLGGRVQSLISSIYSDPPMAPSDAMAFLLTGRPLSGASHEEANMLLSAVTTLGIEHGEVITGGIQSAFGLDTFAIEGGETVQDTALVIGKHLTPRLLISYSEKLFERASTVTLSYELGPRTTVQAESGEGQSIDIIFQGDLGR